MSKTAKIIVATDAAGGFGKDGKIPWYFKEDFAFFRQQTLGQVCVMGRITYDEINEKLGEKGRESVLPGRKCYVISRTLKSLPNAHVISSLSDVVEQEYFVIGGKTLFNEALMHAKYLYHTAVCGTYDCDVRLDLKHIHTMYEPIQAFPSTNPQLTFTLYSRKNK